MENSGTWKRFRTVEEPSPKKGERPIFRGVVEDYKGKTYISLWPTPTFEEYLKKVFK